MLTEQEIVERYEAGYSIDYIAEVCTYEDFVERWKDIRKSKKEKRQRLTKGKARELVELAIKEHIIAERRGEARC